MPHRSNTTNTRPRLRSITTSLALVAAGTFIGVSSQQFASADISTGSRPVLIPIEPCRLSDTRPGDNQVGPRSVPLGAEDTHTIDAQEPDTPCTGKIPADATALSLNVTALNAPELSFLTVWAGGDRPLAASLNPAPGQPPVPNAVTTQLSVDQEFEVYNSAGTVNIVTDVNGYYSHHHHDDRYSQLDHHHDDRYPRTLAFAVDDLFANLTGQGQIVGSLDVDLPSPGTLLTHASLATISQEFGNTVICSLGISGLGAREAYSEYEVLGTVAVSQPFRIEAAGVHTLELDCDMRSPFDTAGVRGNMSAIFIPD